MADKKTIGIYKAYLKEHLSKKRYTHSMNVANSAVELAKRYGADADKAYIAGLLHDVAKEIPALELAAIVSKSSLDVCEQSLEKAMFEALKFSIKDSVEKGNTIPVSTLEAYNDFADNSK